MASTHPTTVFNGHSCCVDAAVSSFEASAYVFLEAFSRASPPTQHVIVNEYVPPAVLHGMSLTFGAATLVEALGAMLALTTSSDAHAPEGALIAAADFFEATAAVVIQAVEEADEDTQHAINESYWSFDPPDIDLLDPPSTAAWLARAVRLTQTDAVSLTIDQSGGQSSGSPDHLRNNTATATAKRTTSRARLPLTALFHRAARWLS